MVCFHEAAALGDVDAEAEDVAVVWGAGVGVVHFVGGEGGAGAVDVGCVAAGLLGEEVLDGGGGGGGCFVGLLETR